MTLTGRFSFSIDHETGCISGFVKIQTTYGRNKMVMRFSNLLKGILLSAFCLLPVYAVADGMMKDSGMMGASEKSMTMDESHSMKSEGEMKTMEGDMKAMEVETDMKMKDKMDDMEMRKEEGEMMMDGMKK
ncbi:MAG: hypothetical protein KZQ95_16965 [Candidatus Thiodiazotropha sp. (ex Epidulcina cf. delphinae)]|nr:hypothetical protein [Candidatus Thiodiazotropha sp. (ex Epidulcina cf. delphinae)]